MKPIISLLDQCSSARILRPIHARLLVAGLVRYAFVSSRVLACCCRLRAPDPDYSRRVFDAIPHPTPFNWNLMIRSQPAVVGGGVSAYSRMRRSGVAPNMHTFPAAVKGCDGLPTLSQVHGQVLRFGVHCDVFVVSSLISKYAAAGEVELALKVFEESVSCRNVVCWTSLVTGLCNCGGVEKAREVFDVMPERNESSWSAMIAGYVKNERHGEALELFHEMRKLCEEDGCGPGMNESLLVSALDACARLGASEMGKWIHECVKRRGLPMYGLEIGTALVDFYTKIGCLESAREVFGKLHGKDVTAWSAMIMGLAVNGHGRSAIEVFSEMLASGVAPNAITFIGVLSACSHCGFVHEGLKYFKAMSESYGIDPTNEHYGCMVDLLARAGKINEAERLIEQMPVMPDAAVLGALLNGCAMHKNEVVGERVGRRLIELEPQHAGRYVGLANVYASMGSWEGVVEVRKMMRQSSLTVAPGWSSVEIGGGLVRRFLAGDRGHDRMQDIIEMLKVLERGLPECPS